MPRTVDNAAFVGSGAPTGVNGSCWESARSSWIYMDMSPAQRTRWLDNSTSHGEADVNGNGVLASGSGVQLDNTSRVPNSTDDDSGLGRADCSFRSSYGDTKPRGRGNVGAEEEEDEEDNDIEEEEEEESDEGDYAVIEEEKTSGDENCYASCDILLSNENFVLKRDNSAPLCTTGDEAGMHNPLRPPAALKMSVARRSVSLDSCPIVKPWRPRLRHSETADIPRPARPALHGLPPLPLRPTVMGGHGSPLTPGRLTLTSGASSCLSTPEVETLWDNLSVTSVGTLATVSTTTSWGSLCRIPTKVRKLSTTSSSHPSRPTALAAARLLASPASEGGVSPQGKRARGQLMSQLPAPLRDAYNFLWCDNPDRDPFNTFSVSETDLTSAIAHLEHQLSNSTRGKGQRSRVSVFSGLVQQEVEAETKGPSLTLRNAAEGANETSTETSSQDGESRNPSQSLPYRLQFIMESYCNIYMMRKQDLRELKLLQKQENKQITDLQYKNHLALETKERKFDLDSTNLKKHFDQDLDGLTKQQKQLIEKAEQAQQNDMKNAAKRLRGEQEKELKMFREKQRQEMKLLKQELDLLPRDNKKEAAQKIRETRQIEMEDKERTFMENQVERTEKHMRQLADQHRQKIALLESQCLQQKQQMFRGREASMWEMEKSQLHERNQLIKTQLKDLFFVKRHQMLTRHQKEMDNLKRYNQMKEDEMASRHSNEKRRLPKILKNEAKTRAQMFKQSLRLSTVGSPEDDKVKIKQFEESEKKRMKSEQLRQEEKHKKQFKALMDKNEAAVKELEQLQGEKRKMLMEQETQKIKELEEQFSADMNEWKALLIPRKQALEEQFQRETEEQQSFYADVVSADIPGLPSTRQPPSSQRGKQKDGSLSSRHSTVI